MYYKVKETERPDVHDLVESLAPNLTYEDVIEAASEAKGYVDGFKDGLEAGGEDQHAKADVGKPKLTLVPRRVLYAIAAIREYGNNKYPEGGPDNWKTVEADRYRDAAFRHFVAYLDDPYGVDEESGFPHLWHLACNVAFLCEMEDIYLSKNPEVVESLKKDFKKEGEPMPPRDWSSAQTDE